MRERCGESSTKVKFVLKSKLFGSGIWLFGAKPLPLHPLSGNIPGDARSRSAGGDITEASDDISERTGSKGSDAQRDTESGSGPEAKVATKLIITKFFLEKFWWFPEKS